MNNASKVRERDKQLVDESMKTINLNRDTMEIMEHNHGIEVQDLKNKKELMERKYESEIQDLKNKKELMEREHEKEIRDLRKELKSVRDQHNRRSQQADVNYASFTAILANIEQYNKSGDDIVKKYVDMINENLDVIAPKIKKQSKAITAVKDIQAKLIQMQGEIALNNMDILEGINAPNTDTKEEVDQYSNVDMNVNPYGMVDLTVEG